MLKKVTLTFPIVLLFLHLMYASEGLNWIRILSTAGAVWDVRVHPTNSNIIYANSTTTGVWKSDDRGLSFAQFNGGINNTNIQSLAICRSNPDVLYAGTSTATASERGVYVTTNGGD